MVSVLLPWGSAVHLDKTSVHFPLSYAPEALLCRPSRRTSRTPCSLCVCAGDVLRISVDRTEEEDKVTAFSVVSSAALSFAYQCTPSLSKLGELTRFSSHSAGAPLLLE